jgi:tetratricopeptide (TPR) repeat protein
MGVYNEINNNQKEALNFYKKSLKTKFHLFGDNHDEVLDLQYKIASVYISLKQFKEAEEIMMAMTDVVTKEKLRVNTEKNENFKASIDNYYRYGVYFYTAGVLLLKNNRNFLAKEYLNKANVMWKDIVNPNDPGLTSIKNMLKICDRKV